MILLRGLWLVRSMRISFTFGIKMSTVKIVSLLIFLLTGLPRWRYFKNMSLLIYFYEGEGA
jgi:hypothetical protein